MTFRYGIGPDNRVRWLSDEWLAFASANGAPELTVEAVVGRPLFAFISGAETEYLYYLLLDEVRTRGRHIVVPFRCDSPSRRRFMRLEMSPFEKQSVAFVGTLLREEPRRAISFLDAAAARTTAALSICSWCKRVAVDEEWFDLETAVTRLRLFDSPRLPQQNHSACERCRASVRRVAAGGRGLG